MNSIQNTLLVFLIILKFISASTYEATESDPKLATNVNQLRKLISGKIYPNNSLVHKFIQDDLYVERWLELGQFKVEVAAQHFLKHLAWRKAERMDTIHLEDWSRFLEEYPQFLSSTDKMGRPLAESWLSEWDIRSAAVSGQLQKVIRWSNYLSEMAQRALYEIRNKTGNQNITAAVEIIDMEGFNTWKQGCVLCTPFFVALGHVSNQQYPQLWERNYMVNVGPFLRSFLHVMHSNFNYASKDALKLYSGKSEWLPVLEKEIDRNQRSTRFGGTLKRNQGYNIS